MASTVVSPRETSQLGANFFTLTRHVSACKVGPTRLIPCGTQCRMPPVRPPRKGDSTIVLVKFPGHLHAGHPLGPPGGGLFWANAVEAYLWVGERGLWGLVGDAPMFLKLCCGNAVLIPCAYAPFTQKLNFKI
jgi:hypothetical protein